MTAFNSTIGTEVCKRKLKVKKFLANRQINKTDG